MNTNKYLNTTDKATRNLIKKLLSGTILKRERDQPDLFQLNIHNSTCSSKDSLQPTLTSDFARIRELQKYSHEPKIKNSLIQD